MRITQEADYAMRIVCLLAQLESGELDLTDDSRSNTEADTPCENDECRILGAAEITARTMVPPRFTLTILRKMVMSGFVESFKGKNGGYKLSKMPDTITMRDVIEVIDGPVAISRCIDDAHACSKQGFNKKECRVHNIFVKLSESVVDKLSEITIADLISPDISLDELYKLID